MVGIAPNPSLLLSLRWILQLCLRLLPMGFPKARISVLQVKELELVYLGCLVAVLLAFPLRPVDYTDMFRYADPAASLLDPMMSDMIFAIANHSKGRGGYLPQI